MRALIVHDRADVAVRIDEVLRAELGCPIDTVSDVFAAKGMLAEHHYDLAIIDLTLPVMANLPETRLQYAEALLNDIFEGEELKTPADLIGISRDGDAVAAIRTSIGQHVLAIITEDPDGAWLQLLLEKVRYVRNSRRGRLRAATTTHEVDAFILTALDKEFRPYRTLLGLSPCDEFPGVEEFTFIARDGHTKRGVIASAGRSGQVPSASLAQAVVTQLRPRVAIMTGFCGGVRGRLPLGDVAMFTSSAPWDYGKWEEDARDRPPRFRARPDALNIPVAGMSAVVRTLADERRVFTDATVAEARRMCNRLDRVPETRSAAAGSGSAVVTSETILGTILDLNENIHAIDMESYGFYYACLNTAVIRPDFACIKGVADHCNGEKNSVWHEACSFLSASLAIDILRSRYEFA